MKLLRSLMCLLFGHDMVYLRHSLPYCKRCEADDWDWRE